MDQRRDFVELQVHGPKHDLLLLQQSGRSDEALRAYTAKCEEALRVKDYYLAHVCMEQITDRKSTRLNSSHIQKSRMPSSA